jgi:hypothetical protein
MDPVTCTLRRLTLLLTLLSMPCLAAAQGVPAQPTKPLDPWDQARFEITERLKRQIEDARTRELLGVADAPLDSKFKAAGDEYMERVIKPMVAAATSCADWTQALGEHIGFARQQQLLGVGGQGAEQDALHGDDSTFRRAWEVCYEEAFRKCVVDHDLGQIAVMLGYEREAQLLGGSETWDPRLTRCATFELEFETHLSMKMDMQGVPVDAPVEVVGKSRAERITVLGEGGRAPLELSAAFNPLIDLGGGERVVCRGSVAGLSGAVLDVRRLDGELKHAPLDEKSGEPTARAEVVTLEIDVDFSAARGTINNSCTLTHKVDGGGTATMPIPMPPVEVKWPDLLRTAHSGNDQDGVIRFHFSRAEGEIPGGTLFARKSFTRSVPHPLASGTIEERTVLTLWHRDSR